MINETFHRIVDILNQNLKFPETAEEAMGPEQVRLDNHPRVRFIVDATNMKIQKPKRDAGIYRDRKKGYSMKVQITINAAGRAAHVSKVYAGSVHDFRVFKKSGLARFLKKRPRGHHAVVGDKGHLGIHKYIPEAIIPTRKPAGAELTQAVRLENDSIGHDRVLVENFNARLKMLWRMVGQVYRGDLREFKKIIRVCVWLTDFDIAVRPLRRDALTAAGAQSNSSSDAEEVADDGSSDSLTTSFSVTASADDSESD
jgi:hypothetical protein